MHITLSRGRSLIRNKILSPQKIFFTALGISGLTLSSKKLLLLVNGACCSGKTTLTSLLSAKYGWPIIARDEFKDSFLMPWDMAAGAYLIGSASREFSTGLAPVRGFDHSV